MTQKTRKKILLERKANHANTQSISKTKAARIGKKLPSTTIPKKAVGPIKPPRP